MVGLLGIFRVTVVPLFSLLLIEILPPWALMICRAILRKGSSLRLTLVRVFDVDTLKVGIL